MDTREEGDIAASIQAGIDRAKAARKGPPPKSALEQARLKLHKYRRHEKGGGQ